MSDKPTNPRPAPKVLSPEAVRYIDERLADPARRKRTRDWFINQLAQTVARRLMEQGPDDPQAEADTEA